MSNSWRNSFEEEKGKLSQAQNQPYVTDQIITPWAHSGGNEKRPSIPRRVEDWNSSVVGWAVTHPGNLA
jgi:hypothetical protein